ncbi:MAG: class I SAM-dependent methyltransferase [Paludibacter sp.]
MTRAEFDVAAQPGLREQLAAVYAEFRAMQAVSQAVLHTPAPGAVVPRENCPGCAAAVTDAVALFTKHGVVHQQCRQCALVYTAQTLNESADAAQYDDTAFMQAYATLKRHPLYARLEQGKARYYLQQAQQHHAHLHTVLDIGASTGGVMAAAQALGLEGYGIEPDRAQAQHLQSRHGARFATGYFPQDLPADWPRFDLVTLLDVLEHMVEPVSFLRQIRTQLSPDSLLLVQVPNYHSLLVQLEGAANSNFCVGHWQHFTAQTLSQLLARAGFRTLLTSTCISELDRIQSSGSEKILATMRRVLQTQSVRLPAEPDDLYAQGLGYKLFGLFAVDDGAADANGSVES